MTGIYMITVKDVYAYIGQSIDLDKRIKKHRRDIEHGCHPNMDIIGDYSISDCIFKILLECSKDELNAKEQEMYNQFCTTYIMLNKRECGLQGVNGERLTFYGDKNPSLIYKDGDFFIDSTKVRRDNDMYCLTDLILYIQNNSDFDFRPSRVLLGHSFIDRLNALYGSNIHHKRDITKDLKELGVYKVVGARSNKKIYCDFNFFITFAFYSCPQFAASICIMIGNNITGKYRKQQE